MNPNIRRTIMAVAMTVVVPWVALVIAAQASGVPDVEAGRPQTANGQVAYGKLPLSFIQNDGQMDKKVKFYEKGSGHATFFTQEGVYLSLTPDETSKTSPIKLIPLKANKSPNITAEGLQEGKVNYLIGNNPKKWKTNIPTYQAVVYNEIYPGIDMKFYGNNRQMEYDIIVKPGADPSRIKLAYEGINGLRVTEGGDLEIALNGGTLLQKNPIVYQEIDGKRVDVAGAFEIQPNTNRQSKSFSYTFKVASYDRTHPLVIDPILVYSTYLGGSSSDQARGTALDSAGNFYVTGDTQSTNFPTVNPIQATIGGQPGDAFVAKINADGTALVYATYLGGSSLDGAFAIAVDSAGNAYITGNTTSNDFPTVNALQPTYHGGLGTGDAYVAKLNPAGSALVYSTYLGGSAGEQGHGIAVDSLGNAYTTGRTSSVCIDSGEFCFPTTAIPPNPFGPSSFSSFFRGGNRDGYLTKIDATGGLVYSGYLGTVDNEDPWGVAVDASGAAYVVMQWTNPTTIPVENGPDDPDHEDVLVFKVSPDGPGPGFPGPSVGYIKFFGGTGDDIGFYIALDSAGNAYVTGSTTSSDFPILNPIQAAFGGVKDAFVAKIVQGAPDNTGEIAHLAYSTYLGGSARDEGHGIAVDSFGNVYVAGSTESDNFPVVNPIQATNAGGQGTSDAFVTKINAAETALVYSTYIGGTGEELVAVNFGGDGIAVNGCGNAYITGRTTSTDFPTVNPIQGAMSDPPGPFAADAFTAKISNLCFHTSPGNTTVNLENVTLTFSNVTEDGDSAMDESSSGPTPPPGFQPGDPPTYFDVMTTAVYAGTIEVCVNYSGLVFHGANLSLFHYENGTWADATTSHDTVNKVICSVVSSLSPFAVFEPISEPMVFGPANIWVGLKNSDDVGIRFDLRVEVYRNGTELIGSGEVASVPGGSSGFNNAKLNTIPLTSSGGTNFQSGDSLSLKAYVRNACTGSGKNSGHARLWYNDAAADSRLETTSGSPDTHYLIDGFALSGSPGPGPKSKIDIAAGAKCSSFKLFGTWNTTIP